MGKVIAVCNQKGGVGKTTTTLSLGVGLAKKGNRVLLVDDDPQGDLTTSLGFYNQDELPVTISTLYEYVIHDREFDINSAILNHSEGVELIPANIELSSTEAQLVSTMSRESALKTIIQPVRDKYDYILIDCMPSLGMLAVNALTAADSVIIPVQAQYLSAKGMTQLLSTINKVKRYLNKDLEIEGVLVTLSDRRTNLSKQTSNMIRNSFGQYLHVFNTEIPVATKAAEASAHAVSVFEYDSKGTVAEAYSNLTEEVDANARTNGKRMGCDYEYSRQESVFDTGAER